MAEHDLGPGMAQHRTRDERVSACGLERVPRLGGDVGARPHAMQDTPAHQLPQLAVGGAGGKHVGPQDERCVGPGRVELDHALLLPGQGRG